MLNAFLKWEKDMGELSDQIRPWLLHEMETDAVYSFKQLCHMVDNHPIFGAASGQFTEKAVRSALWDLLHAGQVEWRENYKYVKPSREKLIDAADQARSDAGELRAVIAGMQDAWDNERTATALQLIDAATIITGLLGDNLGDANVGDHWYLCERQARKWLAELKLPGKPEMKVTVQRAVFTAPEFLGTETGFIVFLSAIYGVSFTLIVFAEGTMFSWAAATAAALGLVHWFVKRTSK